MSTGAGLLPREHHFGLGREDKGVELQHQGWKSSRGFLEMAFPHPSSHSEYHIPLLQWDPCAAAKHPIPRGHQGCDAGEGKPSCLGAEHPPLGAGHPTLMLSIPLARSPAALCNPSSPCGHIPGSLSLAIPVPGSIPGAAAPEPPGTSRRCLLLPSRRVASPQRFLGWCLKIDIFNLLKIESLAEQQLLFFHSLLISSQGDGTRAGPRRGWREGGPVNRLLQKGHWGKHTCALRTRRKARKRRKEKKRLERPATFRTEPYLVCS